MQYSIWNINHKFDATYVIQSTNKYHIGDLLKIENDFFLVKGINQNGKLINIKQEEYIGNLFSPQTVFFQNFVSSYRYSRYFKFYKLYIHDNKYISRYPLPQIKRFKKFEIKGSYHSEYKNFQTYADYLKMGDESIETIDYKSVFDYTPSRGQNLFVFPDLWSIKCFTEKIKFKYHIVNPTATALSRYKDFLAIKEGKYKNIITTHSGVFQDWKNLKNIIVFDPYKWYYKNQQNPRYFLPDLSKQIKFFYNAEKLIYIL